MMLSNRADRLQREVKGNATRFSPSEKSSIGDRSGAFCAYCWVMGWGDLRLPIISLPSDSLQGSDVGDFNGDQVPDIAVADDAATGSTVSVLLNQLR
jgi:hypothetical protein